MAKTIRDGYQIRTYNSSSLPSDRFRSVPIDVLRCSIIISHACTPQQYEAGRGREMSATVFSIYILERSSISSYNVGDTTIRWRDLWPCPHDRRESRAVLCRRSWIPSLISGEIRAYLHSIPFDPNLFRSHYLFVLRTSVRCEQDCWTFISSEWGGASCEVAISWTALVCVPIPVVGVSKQQVECTSHLRVIAFSCFECKCKFGGS